MKHSIIVFVLLYSIWGVSLAKLMPPPPLVDSYEVEKELNMLITTSPEAIATGPVQGCETEEGIIPVGKTLNETQCKQCTCAEDGILKCSETVCPKLNCVDYIDVEDNCCPICPNGENCYTPKNIILKAGEIFTESGLKCKCKFSDDDLEEPTAICAETFE